MDLRKLFPFLFPPPRVYPDPRRGDPLQMARTVLDMDDEKIQLSAKHDPDLFRDLAGAYIVKASSGRGPPRPDK